MKMARKKTTSNANSKAGTTNAGKKNVRRSNRNKLVETNENIEPSTSKDCEDSSFEYELEEEYSESEVEETEIKTTKKSTSNTSTKKAKTTAQKIECVSIKYDIPDVNHPNHCFHQKIDRVPINDIIGFNETISKNDVSFKTLRHEF